MEQMHYVNKLYYDNVLMIVTGFDNLETSTLYTMDEYNIT